MHLSSLSINLSKPYQTCKMELFCLNIYSGPHLLTTEKIFILDKKQGSEYVSK